jgi:hypothetical protein
VARSIIPNPRAWQVEAMRELLVLIRDHVVLPEDIVAKIHAALRG